MDPNAVLEWKPVNDLLIAAGESHSRASRGCQQVSLWHSWQSCLEFGIIHVCFGYVPKPLRRMRWLHGLCIIAVAWLRCGAHLPQAQILRVTHCCCLLCFHGLCQIDIAVTQIQCSASSGAAVSASPRYAEISICTWCRHSSRLPWLPAVCCKSAELLLMTWRV